MNTHTLELDLSKDGLGAGLVRVGQGDKHGTTIKALIYDGGAEAALTGFTAYLEVLLPNKRNYYRAAAAISGNAATVTVDENKLCSVAGYTDEAYFAFEKDGVRYSTERFAIEILRCVTEGQKPAQSWDDAIDNLISRGNAAVSAANNAAGSRQHRRRCGQQGSRAGRNGGEQRKQRGERGHKRSPSRQQRGHGCEHRHGAANSAAQAATSAAKRRERRGGSRQHRRKPCEPSSGQGGQGHSGRGSGHEGREPSSGKGQRFSRQGDKAAADAHTAADDAREATKRRLASLAADGRRRFVRRRR